MFNKKIDENALKEAFDNVKEDIFTLGDELNQLKSEFYEIKDLLYQINNNINELKIEKLQKTQEIPQKEVSTDNLNTSTHPATPTHNSTVPQEIQGLKYPNLRVSNGNRGASTDRQTDNQTDISTHNYTEIKEITPKEEKIENL